MTQHQYHLMGRVAPAHAAYNVMKRGPQYKIARMVGERIFPKTQTTKFAVSGMKKRSSKRPPRPKTEYGLQLLEKQKARFSYGVTERQFVNYVKKAQALKGNPVANLFLLLESRLDNTVFRMGIVHSRIFARQIVSHGHITVNGRKVRVPSYHVKPGDIIAVREGSRGNGIVTGIEERTKGYTQPAWVAFDPANLSGKVTGTPTPGAGEASINFGTIIEFYSRV